MGKKSKSKKPKGGSNKNHAIMGRVMKIATPQIAVKMIRSGIPPTGELIRMGPERVNILHRERLIDEGLISALLENINKCDEAYKLGTDSGQLGPGYWVGSLGHIVTPTQTATGEPINKFLPNLNDDGSVRLEIASGIGKMVKYICDDVQRQFFQSEKYWYTAMQQFLVLIRSLTYPKSATSCKREVAKVLVKYDGVVALVIRCLFWNTHRPDVMQGLVNYGLVYADIEQLARDILDNINMSLDEGVEGTGVMYFGEEGQEIFKAIALTSIVSPSYKKCDTQYVIGLVNMIQAKGFDELPRKEKQWFFDHLATIVVAGCVDKLVISRVVDLGFTSNNFDTSTGIISTTFEMLCPRTGGFSEAGHQVKEDDTRFAIAVNYGLVEMCLKLLAQFKDHESNSDLLDKMFNLLDSLNLVALLSKTSKAISGKRNSIEEKLQPLKRSLPRYGACHDILTLVETIVSCAPDSIKSGKETCHSCSKELEKDKIRRCGRCKRAIYCSRECQVDHWKRFHKFCCKNFAEHEQDVKKNSGTKKELKERMAMFDNVGRAGRQYIFSKWPEVFLQAMVLGYDILECVVFADLRSVPHSIDVMLKDDFLKEYGESDPNDADLHAKELIETYMANGALVCAFKTTSVFGISSISQAPIGGSWSATKNQMEEYMRSVNPDYENELRQSLQRDIQENPEIIKEISSICSEAFESALEYVEDQSGGDEKENGGS